MFALSSLPFLRKTVSNNGFTAMYREVRLTFEPRSNAAMEDEDTNRFSRATQESIFIEVKGPTFGGMAAWILIETKFTLVEKSIVGTWFGSL
jgi:hypothetical protein